VRVSTLRRKGRSTDCGFPVREGWDEQGTFVSDSVANSPDSTIDTAGDVVELAQRRVDEQQISGPNAQFAQHLEKLRGGGQCAGSTADHTPHIWAKGSVPGQQGRWYAAQDGGL
jgi:hypothetical protein